MALRGFSVPTEFSAACPNPNMDCAAEMTILSYLARSNVAGANAKAAQEDGMEASRANFGRFNLGVDGIKLVARTTAQSASPSAHVLGGAQFNSSFTNFTLTEGCTSKFPPRLLDRPSGCTIPPSCAIQMCMPVACIPQACLAPSVTPSDLAGFQTFKDVPRKDLISPEQALYNVLKVYFDRTPAASPFGATPGPTHLDYLQIYAVDFQYAAAHAQTPQPVTQTGGATVSVSAQDLLNQASQKVFEIAEPASPRRD